MMKKLKKSRAGFTLVELIVVVAILGVLMAALVPQYVKYIERSREGVDRSTLSEIYHIVEIEAASREVATTGTVLTITVNQTEPEKGKLSFSGTFNTNNAVSDVISNYTMKSTAGKALTTLNIAYDTTNGVYWEHTTAQLTIGDAAVAGKIKPALPTS